MLRWYGAVEGVGPDEKILLSLDSSEVFEICATFISLFFSSLFSGYGFNGATTVSC